MGHEINQSGDLSAILPPLEDYTRQIRLLKVDPAAFGQAIRCTTVIHELDKAPSFNAISYTWGPEYPQRDIFIDGLRFAVRENCHYAIQQARSYQGSSLIWVDSVCIDQGNLHEKSAQVAIMGEIYACAATVLACIGESDLHSELVTSIFDGSVDLAAAEASSKVDKELQFRLQRQARNYLQPNGRDVATGFIEFCRRPYFHRLWIVQELFLGRHRAVLLCGQETMSWYHLMLCVAAIHHRDNPQTRSLVRLRDMIHDSHVRYKLPNLLENSADLLCADPRDRIYGVLQLVDWAGTGRSRPVPDYSLSSIQIALNLLDGGHFNSIREVKYLSNALAITEADIVNTKHELLAGLHKVQQWDAKVHDISLIQLRDDGQLYAEHGRGDSAMAGKPMPSETDIGDFFDGEKTIEILGPTGTVAVVCAAARPGDLLVETAYFDAVLRPCDQLDLYRVIGKAVVVPKQSGTKVSLACSCRSLHEHSHSAIKADELRSIIHLRFETSVRNALLEAISRETSRTKRYKEHRLEAKSMSLVQMKHLDILKRGSVVRDVNITRFTKSFRQGWWLPLPAPACKDHRMSMTTYKEAAKRGPLYFCAVSGGGRTVEVFVPGRERFDNTP
ncbi:heterokaryon incompatibility protein-domain-containing protein [Microdochium trichocladiopsis]|uniref:Heterokaryon incompatibility protein-domain-containing protein n=1 Tax=Microdochium trichocladiopsis TaxID=1682393 RepID=A0A9P8XZM9_9PEZI|nr:heterokaryon incompatibility protein-domain-containing protein [Microdochium trichocladiopsis]KAH7026655.1 heterokaryon incompatibility protein-domain-containing protein [Microdochium trichocladiopsis]